MVYENLQQLLEQEIVFVAESDTHYFICLRPEEYYENSMWVVDKETKLATFTYFTSFLGDHLDKDAREIDVNAFRRSFE